MHQRGSSVGSFAALDVVHGLLAVDEVGKGQSGHDSTHHLGTRMAMCHVCVCCNRQTSDGQSWVNVRSVVEAVGSARRPDSRSPSLVVDVGCWMRH